MPLKLITPPPLEPVTLAQFKLHSRISRDDEDSLIQGYIAAARIYAETRQRRQLITATWQLKLDSFYPCGLDGHLAIAPLAELVPAFESRLGYGGALAIRVPLPPLQSVSSIQYIDTDGVTQTIDPSKYVADCTSEPGRITPAYGEVWPLTRAQVNAVTITFVAGYGDVPASVPATTRQAVLMLAAHYYENREAVVTGTIATAIPMAVDALLGAESFGGYV